MSAVSERLLPRLHSGRRRRADRPFNPGIRLRQFLRATGSVTTVVAPDDAWSRNLPARFQSADLDGNGYIDKYEFRGLAQSTASGREYNLLSWISDEQLDELFARYDKEEAGRISYEAFKRLAEDGVLLEGRLSEYRDIFDTCDVDDAGTIGVGCVQRMGGQLDPPLAPESVVASMAALSPSAAGRVTFADFLTLFRDNLLDLKAILRYMAMKGDASAALPTPTQRVAAAEVVPTLRPGVPMVLDSSEQFDAAMTAFPDRVVVLLAGLSWCRPCMALSRPFEKLAERYSDAIFLKVYGDTNDNTKMFFKSRLQVKATPHLSCHRNGEVLHSHTGANKYKLETAIRAHYNSHATSSPLPSCYLYPETKKPAEASPHATPPQVPTAGPV